MSPTMGCWRTHSMQDIGSGARATWQPILLARSPWTLSSIGMPMKRSPTKTRDFWFLERKWNAASSERSMGIYTLWALDWLSMEWQLVGSKYNSLTIRRAKSMEDQFDPWQLQDRYDLWFLEFRWICLRLEWKITTMSLIYFTWFRTHGKWGCGNMVSPYAAEFCTVLVTAIFTINGVYGEKLQRFCLQ